MSQDAYTAIDQLRQQLDNSLEAIRLSVESAGSKIVAQVAKFHNNIEDENLIPSQPEFKGPPAITLETLKLVRDKLDNVREAFSRCCLESDKAKKVGKLQDDSFLALLTTWSDCRNKYLPKLLAFKTIASENVPSVRNYFLKLEKYAEYLDKMFREERRKELLIVIETFDRECTTFSEVINIYFNKLLERVKQIEEGVDQ